MSLNIFTRTFRGSLALAAAQLICNSRLQAAISMLAPTADVRRIVHAGANVFSSVVTPEELSSVLDSYAHALN
jgi:hypothetical protein